MSFAEIADTTPADFDELHEQWLARLDRENQRFGLVTAAIYNSIRTESSQRFFTSSDFFPVLSEDQPEPEPATDHRAALLDDWWLTEKTAYKLRKANGAT